METFKQGESKAIELEVLSTPAPNFNTAEDIIAILFVGDTVQYRYSLNDKEAHGKLELVGESDTKVTIYVEREHSVAFDAGALTVNITASFPDDDFPEGLDVKSYDMKIGRILRGRGLDEII